MQVELSYVAAQKHATRRFMPAYAQECTAGGGGLAVTHCTVKTCELSSNGLDTATFASLLQALPALQSLEFVCDVPVSGWGDTHTAVEVIRSLAGCQHLRTLLLDEGFLGAFDDGDTTSDGEVQKDAEDDSSSNIQAENSEAEASPSAGESSESGEALPLAPGHPSEWGAVPGSDSDDGGYESPKHTLAKAVAHLKHLQVLSLGGGFLVHDLSPLARLASLECLCIGELRGGSDRDQVLLPSIYTLRSDARIKESIAEGPGYAPKAWERGWRAGCLYLDTLSAFSNLLWLEVDCVAVLDADELPALCTALQRFASTAHCWVLEIDMPMLAGIAAEQVDTLLQPGSLWAVQNVRLMCD